MTKRGTEKKEYGSGMWGAGGGGEGGKEVVIARVAG